MDFIYLFRVLMKRKWIIIGAAILAAVLAYFLTANQPRKFRSSSQITTGFAVPEDITMNDNGRNIMEAENKFNNAIVTFSSPVVINLLSYSLMLHDLTDPEPFKKLSEEDKLSWRYKYVNLDRAKPILQDKLNTMGILSPSNKEERQILELIKLYGYDFKTVNLNLSVYRVQHTDYIQIDYISENPELSAFVVNNIYKEFIDYWTRTRSTVNTQSIDTLRSIMDKKKQVMDDKNAQLNARGITLVEESGKSSFEQLATLEQNLDDERIKRTQLVSQLQMINQRIKNLDGGSTTTTPTVNNADVIIARDRANAAFREWKANPNDAALKAKYDQLYADYERKAGDAGEASTPTRTGGDNLADLKNQKTDIELRIGASNSNISYLEGKKNSVHASMYNNVSRNADDKRLMADAELANKEYLDAQKKYSDAVDVNKSSVNNFRMVLPGQPAIEAEPSKRKLIVAMAGVAAAITTMLIIIFLTYLDSSIKTPVIFNKTVNLKLISLVNFMDLKHKRLEDIVANKDGSESTIDRNKFNSFRESIRKLRYEIEHTGKKIFLFTSTKKGQGKTTLIQALSYSLSLSKKKVLIIDTNFCNNDLTVQLKAEPILEKIVPYKANGSLVEQVKSYSKDIGVGTVYAIGSEGGDYTPSEILPRENLLHHLHALTSEFDYIFLEGPPLNDFSDSKELAQYVDGVIAVFSATHIVKQIDKQSINFFKELNGKFCGSILNMVDLKNVNAS